jgi:hypothetical protein
MVRVIKQFVLWFIKAVREHNAITSMTNIYNRQQRRHPEYR